MALLVVGALFAASLMLFLNWQEKHEKVGEIEENAPMHVRALYPVLKVVVGVLLLVFFALQIIGDPDRVLRGGP